MNEKLKYFINLTNTPSCEWDAYKQGYALTLAEEIIDYKLPKVDFYENNENEKRKAVLLTQKILETYGEEICVFLNEDSSFKTRVREYFQRYNIDCYWAYRNNDGKTKKEYCFAPETFKRFIKVKNNTKGGRDVEK